MLGLLCALVVAGPVQPVVPDWREARGSYLCQPAYALDEVLRGPSLEYDAQPGDIVLFADYSRMWDTLFALARTGPPHHAAVVIRRPDGTLATVEAGYNETLWCRVGDLLPRLQAYASTGAGRVYVRRRRSPLTEEECARLTAFALAQEGKPYAFWRNAAQITPFRSRGPLRIYVLGGMHGERHSYWCSELSLECLLAAGLLDPETTRPAATYPRDIFFDSSPITYVNKHFNLAADWYPPARWLPFPVKDPGR